MGSFNNFTPNQKEVGIYEKIENFNYYIDVDVNVFNSKGKKILKDFSNGGARVKIVVITC